MKSIKNINIIMLIFLLIVSCTKEQEFVEIDSKVEEPLIEIKLVNDKLKFDNKEALTLFMNQSDQPEIKRKVDEFTKHVFKTK